MSSQCRQLRVLVVHSQEERRSELEWAFLSTPLEFADASDADDALRRLGRADAPDVLVVEGALPGDGAARILQALRGLGEDDPRPWVLGLVEGAEQTARISALGADGLLPSGAPPDAVVSAVRDLLVAMQAQDLVDPLLGATIDGRYQVERELGRGGMGTVYLARHALLDEQVALKVLAGDLAALPVPRARFLREVRTNLQLRHPNVVAIRDCGLSPEGLLYLTMDYSPGRSLRRLLDQDGPLRERQALDLGRQCALALAAAHAEGIVHRDMKPDNVMVEADGLVRVCDFGLARFLTGTRQFAELTEAGMIVGTPHYMAPEAISGQPTDERADLYALGCVLYECLCGVPPFTDVTETGILLLHQTEDPPPLSVHGVEVSPRLEELLLRLLAKDREERPDSAAVVAEVLHSIISLRNTTGTRMGQRLRVLLADDSPMGRKLITGILVHWGHQVLAVPDGQAALQEASARRAGFDLVLLDGEMPHLDGPAAAQAIREAEQLRGRPPVPLALMSSTPENLNVPAGVMAVLAKPVHREQLAEVLTRVLESQRGPASDRLGA